MEEREWKPFRNALDKSDRKKFDDMFDIPRLYTSACSYAVQPVRLYPILMSILLHHFKELTECISEVERIEVKFNNNPMNKKTEEGLAKKLEEKNTCYFRWLFCEERLMKPGILYQTEICSSNKEHITVYTIQDSFLSVFQGSYTVFYPHASLHRF